MDLRRLLGEPRLVLMPDEVIESEVVHVGYNGKLPVQQKRQCIQLFFNPVLIDKTPQLTLSIVIHSICICCCLGSSLRASRQP